MTAEPSMPAAVAPEPVEVGAPPALKPPVDPSSLVHRKLLEGPFWQKIPAYAGVSEAEFLDHKWQAKSSITNVGKLLATVKGLVPDDFFRDAEEGFKRDRKSVV